MVKLFFVNDFNETKFITECEEKQVMKNITKAVKEMNPKYKIYYIRAWEEDGKVWYDVGSHTEFFFTEGEE